MEGVWNKKKVVLPDFIIPGAAKSGTTTLYRILQQHPEVYVPNFYKETYFFAYFGRELPYEKSFVEHTLTNPMEYIGLFKKDTDAKIMGEASIGYMYDFEQSIANIKKFYGDNHRKVKIAMILRNPVDRAYSHYTFLIRNGFEQKSFEEAILPESIKQRKSIRPGFDYLEYGMYYKQVEAFKNEFDEVKIFLFEDLKKFQNLASDLFSFLGVNDFQVKKDIQANPSGIPRSRTAVNFLRKNELAKRIHRMFPHKAQGMLLNFRDKLLKKVLRRESMSDETRANLKSYFKEDILKLEALIERDLSNWYS